MFALRSSRADGVPGLADPKPPETVGPLAFRDTVPDTDGDEDRTTLPSIGAIQLREQSLLSDSGERLLPVVIELRIELDREDSPSSAREAVIDAISVCLSQHGFRARIVDGSLGAGDPRV